MIGELLSQVASVYDLYNFEAHLKYTQQIALNVINFFQKADLAIGDITITYEREQAVDFTMPFMNLGTYMYEYKQFSILIHCQNI